METLNLILNVILYVTITIATAIVVVKIISLFNRKCYISGAITKLPYVVAIAKFHRASTLMHHIGYKAINPMQLVPFDITKGYWWYMRKDIALLFFCNSIYIQNNWRISKGAKIERFIAYVLLKNVIYQ
jgi:hypothetical protein